ncbi:MAG: hypothetical protein JSR80_00035 [Verrucomicrobia bacterium]|nr:hypothetical protein [Verrucomicrobiota bacterium]
MKDRKSIIALAASALLLSTLGMGQLHADYQEIGSGSEVREDLLQGEIEGESLAACRNGKCGMPSGQRQKRWGGRNYDEPNKKYPWEDEGNDDEEPEDKDVEGACGEGTCG